MSKKIYLISLLIIIFILMISVNTTSNAATGSFSVNKSSLSITVGSKGTFTINVSNCEGQFTISSSDTSVATVSSSSEWLSDSTTITVTGKKAGTATITITATDVADTSEQEVTGSKTIKVTVSEVTKSSNASLSNLGITPYDFSNFTSGTTSYTVNVPYETTSISIYATKGHSGQTISGTGTKTLSVGTNTFSVKVTAEDGTTTKTYTLNIVRSATSSVATLSNLGITPEEYDFTTFTSGTTSYEVDVPYEAEVIEIYAEATSSRATVTGTGEKTLEVGTNTFEVIVTAEDGTTQTYTLIITRANEHGWIGLINIEIAGYTLNPEFDNEVYEYQIDIDTLIDQLEITTEVSSDEYEVEIAGNENLQEGENVITILVMNTEDDTTTTYQLIVNIAEEEIDLSEVNYLMNKAQSDLKKQYWIIVGTIILIILLIITYLIQRYKNSKNNNEEDYNGYEEEYQEKYTSSRNIDEDEDGYRDIKHQINDQINELEDEEIEDSKNNKHKKGKRFK